MLLFSSGLFILDVLPSTLGDLAEPQTEDTSRSIIVFLGREGRTNYSEEKPFLRSQEREGKYLLDKESWSPQEKWVSPENRKMMAPPINWI